MNLEFTSDILTDIIGDESYTATTHPSLYQNLKCGDFKIRPLEQNDISTGYIDLICKDESSETSTETNSQKVKEYLDFVCTSKPWMYYNVVLEDTKTSRLIGTGSLIVEQKFIHETALRSRIENISVSEIHRNCGFEVLLLETLSLLAERFGCYKVNMNCPIDLVELCEKLHIVYEKGQNIMEIKFPENKVHGPA